MKRQAFSLTPFPGERIAPDVTIAGSIGRRADILSFRCALRGNLPELVLPAPDTFPRRMDRLWEDTCLELFVGARESDGYWEFNLSPAGHWNVYRFTSYREGMREEPAFASLPVRFRTEPRALDLSLGVDIAKLVPMGRSLEVAVGAVIKTAQGGTSHWALSHSGPRPDFHRRDGFTLIIPASPR